MKVFNNELIIYRGETFGIRKILKNKDGSPYIVSSELENPYWLITVSDNIYSQNGRYIYRKWLNLKDEVRFINTKAVDLKSLGYSNWNAVLPGGYEGDETAGYANVALFFIETNGVKEYKYWKYYNTDEDDYTGDWEEYSCKILTMFRNDVTKNWVEKNYYYSIFLVSGESTEDYLTNTAERLDIDVSLDAVDLYSQIKLVDEYLVKDIDLEKPIVNIDSMYPILEPTKISVLSNLNGGI